MTIKRFGHLPPRYTFALNPYRDVRFSKCPICDRSTYARKFPLLLHVEGFGPCVLGKTCKYCSKCEFIIAHQDELEDALAATFAELVPELTVQEYLVMGTVEKKEWRQRLEEPGTLEEIRANTADFQKYVEIHSEPARREPDSNRNP